MYMTPQTLGFWSNFIQCPQESGGDLLCLGISAVYRISFALSSHYIVLLMVCFLRDECARFINENCWFLKITFIISTFIGLMFVDNSYFVVYVEIAKYCGGVFLIFQVVMLIDVFYLIGERMAKLYDRGYNYMGWVLIFTAIILYSLIIYFNYKIFVWFPCQNWTNWINISLIILITIMTVSGIAKNGSLITSGLLSLYITY